MPTPAEIRETAHQVLQRDYYDLDQSRGILVNFDWLFRPIAAVFEWLWNLFGVTSGPVTIVITAVLVLVLIGLLAHIVYSFRAAMRSPAETVTIATRRVIQHEELEEQSAHLAAQGNWIDASRLLYQAALARLEARRSGRVRPSLTNLEYLNTFKSAWVIENLGVFVDLLDTKWYRGAEIDQGDYTACRGAYERLTERLREGETWSQPAT